MVSIQLQPNCSFDNKNSKSKPEDKHPCQAIDPGQQGGSEFIAQETYPKAESQPPGGRPQEHPQYHHAGGEIVPVCFAKPQPGEDRQKRQNCHWVCDCQEKGGYVSTE